MQKHPLGEGEALSALVRGEETGLDYFFGRYYTPLVFFAQSLTNNGEVAREIASEAFVRVWNTRGSLGEGTTVKPLLYRIARNASIDYLRRQKLQRQHTLYVKHTGEIFDRSAQDRIIETETYRRLYGLLSTLPPRCQQVFRMFYFQDKALKEIAQELGISVNTVKTQKQRAIQLLREQAATLSTFILILCLMF